MAEKKLFIIGRAFWAIFDDFKIFEKLSHPSVKFDKKHDGDIGKLVQPILLELYLNLLQKRTPDYV